MRVVVAAVAIGLVAQGATVIRAQDTGRPFLERAAAAAGGKVLLDQVRTLRIEGRGTRSVGPLRVSSDTEFQLGRPDRFIRTDRLRMAGLAGGETVTGFDGVRFIQRTTTADGSTLPGPEPTIERAQLSKVAAAGLRSELTLLLMGFLLAPFDDSPFTAEHAGVAEGADGRADVIKLVFVDGAAATLFTDVESHLPLMVSWQGVDPLGGPGLLVEHRFHFSDFRPVDRFRWPFVVRRSVDGVVAEELRFDRFTLNTAIDPKLFAVGR